jgi:hypothetical protein
MMTVRDDGWIAVRTAVFTRDVGCVAGQFRIFGKAAADDGCRSRWGSRIEWDDWSELEFDHVKRDAKAGDKAPDDEAHGVAVCPHHHRLSQVWRSDSKVHRMMLRDWLAKHYPEAWQ